MICAPVARMSEEEMRNIDPTDPAVRTGLHEATVDLRDIAVTVDRASAVLDPTIELLEASLAIHRAQDPGESLGYRRAGAVIIVM